MNEVVSNEVELTPEEARPRLPDGEGGHHARQLPAVGERADQRVQPEHEPRSDRLVRRGDGRAGARGVAREGRVPPGAGDGPAGGQAPPRRRRSAAALRARVHGARRAVAAGRADARRAEAAHRALARVPVARRPRGDAPTSGRSRVRAPARAPARPEGIALDDAGRDGRGGGVRGGGADGRGAAGGYDGRRRRGVNREAMPAPAAEPDARVERSLEVHNPATGEHIRSVAVTEEREVEQKVERARRAQRVGSAERTTSASSCCSALRRCSQPKPRSARASRRARSASRSCSRATRCARCSNGSIGTSNTSAR